MTGTRTDADKNKYRKLERIFENSGPLNPEEAYYIPMENVTNMNPCFFIHLLLTIISSVNIIGSR
jgi:hypothetical protein